MAVVLTAVMATALVQEAPHEYLGIALFALVIAHVVLNRRWFKALFRGCCNAVRALQLIVIVGFLACILGQAVSSVVLSKHAFGFLPAIEGASWARRVHMLCSYWGFALAFAHAGLHIKTGVRRYARKLDGERATAAAWAVRVVVFVISAYGATSFVQLGLAGYLLGQVQFAFVDYGKPLPLAFAQYASVGVLLAAAFHCVGKALDKFKGKGGSA